MFESCRQAIAASRALEAGVDPTRPTGERGRASSRSDFRQALWLATAGGDEVLDLPVGRLYLFSALGRGLGWGALGRGSR
jgi:guanine deaminase